MHDPADSVVICSLDELRDGATRGFVFDGPNGPLDIFLVRQDGTIYAYENRCPHTGTPLDWMPDQFLSADGSHIVCATHGAQFQVKDGYCFGGPCAGESLKTVRIAIRDGMIVLASWN